MGSLRIEIAVTKNKESFTYCFGISRKEGPLFSDNRNFEFYLLIRRKEFTSLRLLAYHWTNFTESFRTIRRVHSGKTEKNGAIQPRFFLNARKIVE